MTMEPTPRPEPPFDELVQRALSGAGMGDTSGNFNAIRFSLKNPGDWPEVQHVKTYEAFWKYKYERRPDLAEAVLARSDKSFLAAYDAAMQKINDAIGAGIKSKEQAEEVGLRCADAQKIVSDFCTLLGEVKGFIDQRGIAPDSGNNFQNLEAGLFEPEMWPKAGHVLTYAQRYAGRPGQRGELIVSMSNAELVRQYDAIVAEINEKIGSSVTSQAQVDEIMPLIGKGMRLVHGDDVGDSYKAELPDSDAQRQQLELDVRNYIGPRGISPDSLGPVQGVCAQLRRQETWPNIQPLKIYEQYTRGYIPAGMGDYASNITNRDLVAQYDAVIEEINSAIGDAVTIEEQKKAIFLLASKLEKIVRG